MDFVFGVYNADNKFEGVPGDSGKVTSGRPYYTLAEINRFVEEFIRTDYTSYIQLNPGTFYIMDNETTQWFKDRTLIEALVKVSDSSARYPDKSEKILVVLKKVEPMRFFFGEYDDNNQFLGLNGAPDKLTVKEPDRALATIAEFVEKCMRYSYTLYTQLNPGTFYIIDLRNFRWSMDRTQIEALDIVCDDPIRFPTSTQIILVVVKKKLSLTGNMGYSSRVQTLTQINEKLDLVLAS